MGFEDGDEPSPLRAQQNPALMELLDDKNGSFGFADPSDAHADPTTRGSVSPSGVRRSAGDEGDDVLGGADGWGEGDWGNGEEEENWGEGGWGEKEWGATGTSEASIMDSPMTGKKREGTDMHQPAEKTHLAIAVVATPPTTTPGDHAAEAILRDCFCGAFGYFIFVFCHPKCKGFAGSMMGFSLGV